MEEIIIKYIMKDVDLETFNKNKFYIKINNSLKK